MKKPEASRPAVVSDLVGIPGIGAARREALVVAGITTRAMLARATIDQLIGITGIQRSYATKALEIAKHSIVDDGHIEADIDVPTDEALPDENGVTQPAIGTEPGSHEPEPPFELDIAISSAKTAIADTSRKFDGPPVLGRELLRFAKFLDRLPQLSEELSAKSKLRISKRLNRATIRLEKTSSKAVKLSKSTAGKLASYLETARAKSIDLINEKRKRN